MATNGIKRRRLPTLLWRASVIALFLILLLKWGVVDGFEVHGNSMEPLLRDRQGEPDLIMVFKRHFDLFGKRRFGLVVFDRPERAAGASLPSNLQGDLFVKRLVGFPGEQILVRGGDLFVCTAGDFDSLARPVERDLPLLLDMLKSVSRLDHSGAVSPPWSLPVGCERDGEQITLVGQPDRPALIRYGEFVRDDWIDEQGRLQLGGSEVNDVAVSFRVAAENGALVFAELKEAGDSFSVRLSCSAPARFFRRRGPGNEEQIGVSEGPVLLPGVEASVLFLNVDNRLILLVDGSSVLELRYDRNTQVVGMPSNVPSLGVLEGRARFGLVEILRDVFYSENDCSFGVREPYEVPQGEYFLLGDNSVNSRDSRHFGSVPGGRFVGRPFLIVHPFHRFRAL